MYTPRVIFLCVSPNLPFHLSVYALGRLVFLPCEIISITCVNSQYPRAKYGEVNQILRFIDIAVWIFFKMAAVCRLGYDQPEMAPCDPTSPKNPTYKTKHEVDRMTRRWDMAVWSFLKCVNGPWRRLSVGRSSIFILLTLISYTPLFATLGTLRARSTKWHCKIYQSRVYTVSQFKRRLNHTLKPVILHVLPLTCLIVLTTLSC